MAINLTVDDVTVTGGHKTMTLSSIRRDHYTALAKRQLEQAQQTRQHYDDLLQAAILSHGDLPPGKSAISGIYAEHFPESIKNDLRTYAHNIGVQIEQAYALWRKAGRRMHTLRPFADAARVLKGGRISYY